MDGFKNIYENFEDVLKIFKVNYFGDIKHKSYPIETEYGSEDVHVFDNVYQRPELVREYLSKQYFTKDLLPGVYSTKKDMDVWASDSVVRHLCGNFRYLLREITPRHRVYYNDICRSIILKSTIINEPLNNTIHQDLVKPTIEDFFIERDAWQSVIYLNTPDECSGGTSTYRLRDVRGSGFLPGQQKNALKDEDFIETLYTEMKFNRMVTYPGHVWHGIKLDHEDDYIDFYRVVQTFNWRKLV